MTGSVIDQTAVNAVLEGFLDPETGRSVTKMGQIANLRIEGSKISVSLGLTTHSAPLWQETIDQLEALLKQKFPAASEVSVERVPFDRPPEKIGQIGLTAKSVIAVGSGKGGVGKSTIAASLALGLHRAGCQVGLMDADVYGPSIPHLLGVSQRPEIVEGRIQPINAAGINVMSMGFLVPPGEAVVWRGPMLHGAIQQFLRDTEWGPLDYLIIDMPPGTGDIALTLSQLLPLTGTVIVCTPQDVALLDAIKAIAMFRKVNIPILGLVENMSYFVCSNCSQRHEIFGHGGAKQRATELDVPFLGEVPLNISIRQRGDSGETAANFDDELSAECLLAIATHISRQLADKSREEPPLPSLNIL